MILWSACTLGLVLPELRSLQNLRCLQLLCHQAAVFTEEGQKQIRKNIAYYQENAAIIAKTMEESAAAGTFSGNNKTGFHSNVRGRN